MAALVRTWAARGSGATAASAAIAADAYGGQIYGNVYLELLKLVDEGKRRRLAVPVRR